MNVESPLWRMATLKEWDFILYCTEADNEGLVFVSCLPLLSMGHIGTV